MAKTKVKQKKEKIEGIEGWLILALIILILNAIFFSVMGIVGLISYFTDKLTNFRFFIFYSISFLIALYNIFILILFFKKKKSFTLNSIILAWIEFAFATFFVSIEFYYFINLRYLISAALWTLYFLFSKRVKNTFVK
jgi:hypothetical protein